MTIYDELVQSSSALYGSEKAVETEQNLQQMREQQAKWQYENKLERKERKFSRLASMLGLLSQGYKDIMASRDLEKKGQEMIGKNFISKEMWGKMKPEDKWTFWYDYQKQNQQTWYEKFTSTPPPKFENFEPSYKYER